MNKKLILCLFMIISLTLNSLYLDALLPEIYNPNELVVPALSIIKYGPLSEKTLWTHGHLHKYFLLAVMSPYYIYLKTFNIQLPTNLEDASSEFIKIIFILSRILSVILGTATFYLIYLILEILFGTHTLNIFLAAIVGLSMNVINQSHYATYVINSFFFGTLLIYFLIYFSKYNISKKNIDSKWRTFIIGIIFGLLVSGQYIMANYFYLIAAFTLSFKSTKEFWKSSKILIKITLISIIVFTIVNPFVLFPEFYKNSVNYLIKENTGSALVGNLGGNDRFTSITMLFRYVQTLGVVNSILIAFGIIIAFLVTKKYLKYIFGSWIIFYAIIMNFFAYFPARWMLHFLVPLIILFSITLHYFYKRKKLIVIGVITLMLIFTLLNSLQTNILIKNDSRAIAAKEMRPFLTSSDKILLMYSSNYGPKLSMKKYNITILSINRLNRTKIDEKIKEIDPDYIFSSSFYEEKFLAASNDYPKFGVLLRQNSKIFPFFTFNQDAKQFLLDLHNNKTRYVLFKKYERNYYFPDPDYIDPDLYVYKKAPVAS